MRYYIFMDDTHLDNLKQFITVTVSQSNSNMATKDNIRSLVTKNDDLDSNVDTTTDTLNDRLNDNDKRLTKFDQQNT